MLIVTFSLIVGVTLSFRGYNVVSFPITDQFPFDESDELKDLIAARSHTDLSELTIPENDAASTSGDAHKISYRKHFCCIFVLLIS